MRGVEIGDRVQGQIASTIARDCLRKRGGRRVGGLTLTQELMHMHIHNDLKQILSESVNVHNFVSLFRNMVIFS